MDDIIGRQLGDYQIIEQIGKGGMASVYRAYQPSLDRDVAIKVLPPYYAEQDDSFTQRFKREAKAIAGLRHPNILMVLEAGEQDDMAYIVMEYVDAGTLKDRLREPISLREIYSLVKQIAAALEHAHELGIVHRDIKPSNILLPKPDWALLTDFGLAHIVGGSFLTQSGMTVGTPAYMSPEQGRGERVDHRTDIYALGIMLYEMTVGEVPYTAETPMAVVVKHIVDPLPIPREKNPNIPEELQRIILKALAKNPDDRFQSASEFAAALERVAVDHPDWSAAEMKAVTDMRTPHNDKPETFQIGDGEIEAGMADDPTILPPDVKPAKEAASSEPVASTPEAAPVSEPVQTGSQPGKVKAKKKKKGRGWIIAGAVLGVLACFVIGLGVLNGIRENRQAAQNAPDNIEINVSDGEEITPQEEFVDALTDQAIAEGFDQIGELVDQGDIEMAQEIYAQLEERFPRIWELFMIRRFYPLLDSGETEQALILLNAALAVNPDAPPEAYENSGFLYWDLERPMQALEAFEKTIARYPWYAPAYSDITNLAYVHEGDVATKSLDVMERLNEMNPTPFAAHTLGNLYDLLGEEDMAIRQFHEAKDRYRNALQDDRNNAGWNSLGLATMLYYVDEAPDEMDDHLRDAERLGLKEQDVWLLEELGWLYYEMDECTVAKDLMGKMENQIPGYVANPDLKDVCR
jgi:serine/threonine protein kinase